MFSSFRSLRIDGARRACLKEPSEGFRNPDELLFFFLLWYVNGSGDMRELGPRIESPAGGGEDAGIFSGGITGGRGHQLLLAVNKVLTIRHGNWGARYHHEVIQVISLFLHPKSNLNSSKGTGYNTLLAIASDNNDKPLTHHHIEHTLNRFWTYLAAVNGQRPHNRKHEEK